MKTKQQIIFLLLFNCISLFGFSQDVSEITEIRNRYPDDAAIFLDKTEEFKIFIENNAVKGVSIVHERIIINKETGIKYQNRSIPTSKFIELSKIKASIQIPKGNKFSKKDVEKFEQKDNPNKTVFYDDQKLCSFAYPGAQVGAITNLDYQLNYTEPRFLGNYFWASYIPLISDELKISVQKNINIEFKLFHTEEMNLEFTKEEKKNEVVYTWKSKNKKPSPYYNDAPDIRYYEPHIVFYITDYELDGKKNRMLGTPKDLYSWYKELQKNVNKTEDVELKKITDSLVSGVSEEREKVKKIFYWVQDNISYVAFEDGLGGFVPRDAGVVCSRKFGDCKDMASIINEMLGMAGIKSYLTWIGSRDIPYTYTEVPTTYTDNHMITSYQDKNNNWVFLDGTGKKADVDLYTSFIQGKQALVGISNDSFQLVTVPIKDTSVSQTIDSITIDIKGNLISGKGKILLTGYDALDYFYRTENKNKTELQEFFKNYFSKGSNKVNFKDVQMRNPERQPITITYNFDLPDYVKYNQNEMYINLNMDKSLILEKLTEDRKIPQEMRHKTKKRLVAILNIPDGYKIDYLPSNTRFENNIVGFSCNYQQKENTLILTYEFFINALIIEPSDFGKYNAVITEQVKATNQAVSFIKK